MPPPENISIFYSIDGQYNLNLTLGQHEIRHYSFDFGDDRIHVQRDTFFRYYPAELKYEIMQLDEVPKNQLIYLLTHIFTLAYVYDDSEIYNHLDEDTRSRTDPLYVYDSTNLCSHIHTLFTYEDLLCPRSPYFITHQPKDDIGNLKTFEIHFILSIEKNPTLLTLLTNHNVPLEYLPRRIRYSHDDYVEVHPDYQGMCGFRVTTYHLINVIQGYCCDGCNIPMYSDTRCILCDDDDDTEPGLRDIYAYECNNTYTLYSFVNYTIAPEDDRINNLELICYKTGNSMYQYDLKYIFNDAEEEQ
jgi:hypothetical protein